MKFFIILLFPLLSFAQVPQAQKQLINELRTKATNFCNSFSSQADKDICTEVADDHIKDRLEYLFTTYGKKQLLKTDNNQECVFKLHKLFDEKGWAYNGDESCAQLKAARAANEGN